MSIGITTVAYIGASILFILSLGGLSNQEGGKEVHELLSARCAGQVEQEPGPPGSPQVPQLPDPEGGGRVTGVEPARPPDTPNVDCRFSRFVPSQLGHRGVSDPRTSSSNPCPQARQSYS